MFNLDYAHDNKSHDPQQRWRSDKFINNRTTQVLDGNEWKDIVWHKVRVGDLLKIKNNDSIPVWSNN